MDKSRFVLCEELDDGYFYTYKEYMIHKGEYQPQQYRWVRNKFIGETLNGSDFLHRSHPITKLRGVWISGNKGWTEFCESNKHFYDNQEEWLLYNRTPLKAYVNPKIRICEIHSMKDLEALCQQYNTDIEPLLFVKNNIYPLGEQRKREEEAYHSLFQSIAQDHGGIHLSRNGTLELIDIFFSWDCDNTVIFNPKNVSYELLTNEEVRILGWDKYPWIITLEQYQQPQQSSKVLI